MPGFVLDQGTIASAGTVFTIPYDPLALHEDYPNLDLKAKDANVPGLADPVLITYLVSGREGGHEMHYAGAVFLNGDEVQVPGSALGHVVHLPLVLQ